MYRLRRGNEKLDEEAVRAGRVVGELSFRERLHDPRPGRSIWCASLLAQDGERYVIPALDRAHMGDGIRPFKKGFLIYGEEIIPLTRGSKNIKSERYRQTWYCVPVALDDW